MSEVKAKIDTGKEEKPPKTVIPEYDVSLQHTHFRKNHKFAIKEFGEKVVKEEKPHLEVIGKNSSICRILYGLGEVIKQRLGIDFKFGSLDNHIWFTQLNNKCPDCPENGVVRICFNCGSLLINNVFIPYTELNRK